MLRSLEVKNFRSFQHFSMNELGRVNLLVGTNNSGKTSLLEAIEILVSTGRLEVLWNSLTRRSEREYPENPSPNNGYLVADARHLFYGHSFGVNALLSISGRNDISVSKFSAELSQPETDMSVGDEAVLEGSNIDSQFHLKIRWGEDNSPAISIPINGQVPLRALRTRDEPLPLRFVTTSALDRYSVIADFENVVLTPEEDLVLEALQTIQPNIDRIAPISAERRAFRSERGGMMVRQSGQMERIPIGSMGDGIWRMLGIALSLVNARGGVLLIDEIDTGLHYSVMEKMWHLVQVTAKRLDVQVFATTHSRDCYQALAAIARPDIAENTDVSIQRIERGKNQAVFFTEQEIVIAA
jgi:ABC-type multidrug transport system ATPase subunit